MLVGIRPEVAQTIVSLGIDLQHIVTQANLRAGLIYAMRVTQFDGQPVAR
jgi:rsbT co-antagonist protein RsbR